MDMRLKSTLIKSLLAALLLVAAAAPARAQFLDGASGLMLAPSADMHPSGTFMITNTWLHPEVLPPFPWGYHTFGYSFNITFWSRFEFAYILTLINGSKMANPPSNWWAVMRNQDRHFFAKFLLLRENEFGLKWMPALAVGVSDPVTGAVSGEYVESLTAIDNQNGYFNRYFATLTKHFDTKIGQIGVHAGYQYSFRTDRSLTGPVGGVNWRPKWVQNDWVKLNLMAEYDSRTFNVGLVTTIYRDHFDLLVLLQDMKYFSFGVRYKLVLF